MFSYLYVRMASTSRLDLIDLHYIGRARVGKRQSELGFDLRALAATARETTGSSDHLCLTALQSVTDDSLVTVQREAMGKYDRALAALCFEHKTAIAFHDSSIDGGKKNERARPIYWGG